MSLREDQINAFINFLFLLCKENKQQQLIIKTKNHAKWYKIGFLGHTLLFCPMQNSMLLKLKNCLLHEKVVKFDPSLFSTFLPLRYLF